MAKPLELTEIARWHLLRWRGGRSRFDPGTFSKRPDPLKWEDCGAPSGHGHVAPPLQCSSMLASGEGALTGIN